MALGNELDLSKVEETRKNEGEKNNHKSLDALELLSGYQSMQRDLSRNSDGNHGLDGMLTAVTFFDSTKDQTVSKADKPAEKPPNTTDQKPTSKKEDTLKKSEVESSGIGDLGESTLGDTSSANPPMVGD